MVTSDPAECLARAEKERDLASAATLGNVRDRHLKAARTWEELASRIDRMTRSHAAGRADAAPSASGRRSELANHTAPKRWEK